ncbi:glutamate--cysteine ligase EgtA [Pilimelia terevasa]|uniref:Glutamate--cysteine ligase EgtA n=1 Tax=Pilimelia terevasa TaxID=53372 RepID=A0A8J3BU33_9ACTN|nr:glutamate-cysteine ligase family protein [Pilimelia terevasa]GGK43940.1 glutamate--cysteine ligase EgtA [Pilimelia terevasa]
MPHHAAPTATGPVPAPPDPAAATLTSVGQAEEYVAARALRCGRASRTGVELEFTVHHADDPARRLAAPELAAALGAHAPTGLGGAAAPLAGGGALTLEPGGQVEISSRPYASLDALLAATAADVADLAALLAAGGLALGGSGLDPHRPPHRVLSSPRYDAMAAAYDRCGPAGHVMMRSTAGLQVCVDPGECGQAADRWALVHLLGPPLLAAFATADRHAGRPTGRASARMCAWLDIRAGRTDPVWTAATAAVPPDLAWARYALAAPLLCVRRPDGDWTAPPDVTFADWVGGALPAPPTTDDLDYHLTTLFPPVRPRGYLEIRYLDAQPADAWPTPLLTLSALLATAPVRAEAARLCAPAADRWRQAATHGLADPVVGAAARAVLALAAEAVAALELAPDIRARTQVDLARRVGTRPRGGSRS